MPWTTSDCSWCCVALCTFRCVLLASPSPFSINAGLADPTCPGREPSPVKAIALAVAAASFHGAAHAHYSMGMDRAGIIAIPFFAQCRPHELRFIALFAIPVGRFSLLMCDAFSRASYRDTGQKEALWRRASFKAVLPWFTSVGGSGLCGCGAAAYGVLTPLRKQVLS